MKEENYDEREFIYARSTVSPSLPPPFPLSLLTRLRHRVVQSDGDQKSQ